MTSVVNPFDNPPTPVDQENTDDIVSDQPDDVDVEEPSSTSEESVEDNDVTNGAEIDTEQGEEFPPNFMSAEIPSIENDWPFETLEFLGHTLGVRYPNQAALTSFTMATGAYLPEAVRQNMTSKFVYLHFSPLSFVFLMGKLMDPNAVEFNDEAFGQVVTMLVEAGGKKLLAEIQEQAEQAAKRNSQRIPSQRPVSRAPRKAVQRNPKTN